MGHENTMQWIKDSSGKKITVIREFAAEPALVWRAWTEHELLDKWWAPKPWRAETKHQDFKVGGYWLYAMVSPENERHWARADYTAIEPQKTFSVQDSFCDEEGNRTADAPPSMKWRNSFNAKGDGTEVTVEIDFESEEGLKAIINMGFREGFTAAIGNLDDYLAAGFKLRNEMKTNNAARVTTYLNFPGNTEEAFNFYKEVFRSEFSGKGLQRFSDIPADAGHGPVADSIKNMILHVELPILGGHVLMATDAPKEMGFNLTSGNNMHICLEPETREETTRLFNALSDGGKVTMPMADMFFGAYFGECSDKYGINWMFNHINK
jgi:uncharacterized glyoxalase superfamily protein PhnB/uncharacterized protein YndB with AHSA1/START domain